MIEASVRAGLPGRQATDMTTIQDFFASGDGNTNEVHIGNHGYDGVCSWTRGRKERNSERLRGRGKELVGGMEVFAELQAGLKIVDCTVVGFYISSGVEALTELEVIFCGRNGQVGLHVSNDVGAG